MALAATMVVSGVARASAQPWQGQEYHHGEARQMAPQPRYQPQPPRNVGWQPGYEHHGWERPVPQGYVAYAPSYAPAYAPGYPVVEEDDNTGNVVGAVMFGVIAGGILAAALAHH